jgi:two-component system sensor histidine kinase UhpB
MVERRRNGLHDQAGTGIQVAGSTRTLIEAQEEERGRIARDLHDVVGQALSAARLTIVSLRDGLADPVARTRLQDSLASLDQALATVRTFATGLRPAVLDDLGLEAAIRWQLNRGSRDGGFEASFACEPLPRLPADVEIGCFRVFQEAFTNITRHAAARNVSVDLREAWGSLELIVRDDGAGFEVEEVLAGPRKGKSMGLTGMSERARILGGTVVVRSMPGYGTEVRAMFPTPIDMTVDRVPA